MASSFFKRILGKYNKQNLTGKKYQKVVNEILVHNNEKMGRAVGRLSNDNYKDQVKKISKKRATTVKLPEMDKVIPKRSVFLIKAADHGKTITQTLHDQLERDLRASLKEFDGTGKNRMEIQRGKSTGKINPELIQSFQKRIEKTYESRTKRDKKTGVPPKVKNIAVTEIRSTVNAIKAKYNEELLAKNPQLTMVKTWLHNRLLSKTPREAHMALDGVTIPVDERFKVDREDGSGFDYMKQPHDPEAPAAQTIGCNCDIVFKAQFIELKEI